jgi:hypothetical protein
MILYASYSIELNFKYPDILFDSIYKRYEFHYIYCRVCVQYIMAFLFTTVRFSIQEGSNPANLDGFKS